METQVVELLKKMFPATGQIVPNGDDAAVLRTSSRTAVTVDTHVEDIHFRWGWAPPEALGERFVGVVLSDLAAMGALPQYGVLSLMLPPGFPFSKVRRFASGMMARATREGFLIAGGDISSGKSFAAVLTALGKAPRRPLTRSAQLGDMLCVSGPIGGASADLRRLLRGERLSPRRWLQPPSRIALGQRLAKNRSVHGAMDISDGFFLDARRLGMAAGLGLEIDAAAIPLAGGARSPEGWEALARWLVEVGGGEDYELLVSVQPGRIPKELFPVGRFVPRGFHVIGGGKRLAWPRSGFLHL